MHSLVLKKQKKYLTPQAITTSAGKCPLKARPPTIPNSNPTNCHPTHHGATGAKTVEMDASASTCPKGGEGLKAKATTKQ